MTSRRRALPVLFIGFLVGASWLPACGGHSAPNGSGGQGGGAPGGAGGAAGTGGPSGSGGAGGAVVSQPVVISTAARKPRMTTLGVNYWMWSPTYGDDLPGTEAAIAAVAPAIMRVGGYNNDANTPDPFSEAQLDAAVAYARAIGAEPLLQVPRLADVNGQPSTADTGAAMVRYANITRGYGIKYFSIGNEPDLYDSSGAIADPSLPAMPGYSPQDYCAATRAYVTAMKAVDPTIQIVGPDLAYKYQANANDWLTPILQGCGDLLDVVAIHRYPFAHDQASAARAQADRAAFASTLTAVRALMTAAGYGDKPLALTEMNVAYDATTCVLDASPGTVGAGLWMADILGEAIQHDLWTNAVWDISDPPPYTLGLLDQAPGHVPRPAYHAYALYAQHFGPTVLNGPSTPAGVSAHASRNAADTATEVIVVNWNSSAAALAFQVTGLTPPPLPATFVLPAMSMAAVELPDGGAANAWVYGEAQRRRASGPEPLPPGVASLSVGAGGAGGGAGLVPGTNCSVSTTVCPQVVLPAPIVTTMGKMTTSGLQFGSGAATWGSYTYAGPGQNAPVGVVTADGNGIEITGSFKGPVDPSGDYMGLGLYFVGTSCVNAASYTGVKFDFSGDLGGCGLALGASFSGDLTPAANPGRGTCTAANCYGPSASVVPMVGTATIMVPFSSLAGGMPVALLDPSTLVTVQWQLTSSAATGGDGTCSAAFTVANVSFY